jgi:hypothetical protein
VVVAPGSEAGEHSVASDGWGRDCAVELRRGRIHHR